ncbi:MAG: glycosyltransferase [Phormidesmis sp.]
MNATLNKIHVWMPNLFTFEGGIQAYSANFLRALQALLPNANYSVFSMHDRSATSPDSHPFNRQTRFHCYGKVPERIRRFTYAAQLVSYGVIERPNLIITTHLNFAPVARLIKRLVHIPYWVSAHGIEAWEITNPRLQSALQSADRILPVSDYTRSRLLKEQTLAFNKVQLLPNTFDASRFCIAPRPEYLLERYKLKLDQPVILTIGRLVSAESYKGYDNILRALPGIIQAHPTVHYILAGKGDDQPRINALVEQLNLQEYVTLTGFIPDSELSDHYNLCDVFAMPSKGEGFGIVYLEAMACGKPALGGNQDGATGALCDGKLGALVNPDDTAEIANVLNNILQKTFPNPLMYQPEKLRQTVIEHFGFEKFQQTLRCHLNEFAHAD